MPKGLEMAQLSRPYQIVLAVLVLFALVWFVALRPGGGSSSSSSSSQTPAASSAGSHSSATSGSASASSAPSDGSSASPAAPTHIYHGPAPGVEGLTRDIAKARHAVAESQHNAQELQSKSAQASGEVTSGGGSAAPASQSSTGAAASASTAKAGASSTKAGASTAKATTGTSAAKHGSAAGAGSHSAVPADEAAAEAALAQGKTAVVLFWNDRAADDQRVHEQLQKLAGADHKLAVQYARPSEVASFGSFTRTAQVVATPTVLIVNRKREVTTLTGLTDMFSVHQAIVDATAGSGRVLAPQFTAWTPTSSRAKFVGQANRLCRDSHYHGGGPVRYESIGQLRTAIVSVTSYAEGVFGKVEGLSMPAQDRPFIHRQFGLLRGALHHYSGALNPGISRADLLQRRAEVLEGEAEADQATDSLEAYGLTACG
jgi:hypothetical protein